MNKNFCYHPWTGLDIGNDGEIKPCCKFNPELEDWNKFYIQSGIDSYNNSQELNNLKKQFLEGKRPAGCLRCWKDEDADYLSKRQLDYSNFSVELDDCDLSSNDNFLFLTVPVGNLCNLKCRICGPGSSSSWIKEWNAIFGEKRSVQDWHKNSAVWQDLLNYSKNILEIHIHGGEPFLYDNKEHFELLDHLITVGSSKNIKIHYSTNGTVFPHNDYWDKWKKFKWVDFQLSIDDMEHRFEYNRHPANWNIVKENLLEYRDNVAVGDNLQLSISTTVSVFTIFYLEEFFDFMHANLIPKPWLGRLQRPYYYRVSVFPDDVKYHVRKKLANSKHEDLVKIISWLDDNDSEHWDVFLKYVKIHDEYRKENFQKTFPELVELIGESSF